MENKENNFLNEFVWTIRYSPPSQLKKYYYSFKDRKIDTFKFIQINLLFTHIFQFLKDTSFASHLWEKG
ncbi:MAG: hypothetical protein A2V66_15485 [Ignavibacteria bacterium RBG_13_36_8]|nr:MAG: hypothetical protein A2V66_15485 [Ignavibacteria bacterium RBG_13_36_8]